MKKKRLIHLIMSVVAVFLLVSGGIWFSKTKSVAATSLANKELETERTRVDNHLSNNFGLIFIKHHAYLVVTDSVPNEGYKKSKLSRQILKAYGKKGKNIKHLPSYLDLGRVKFAKIKNGYRVKTKKVTFIFKKTVDGDYKTQDGTRWVFSTN